MSKLHSTLALLAAAPLMVACVETLALSEAAGKPAQLRDKTDRYAGRNGEAEALADLAQGKPVKLYSHRLDGEFPGYGTPGLLNCDPDQNNGSKAANTLFSPLPEANFSEDQIYTEDQNKRSISAFLFAQSYNLAMFGEKRAEIMRVCPAVKVR